MRSSAEISFRLRQELANLRMRAIPPSPGKVPPPPRLSPAIEQLRQTPFAAEVVRLADEIAAHRFPIFGGMIDTGPEIRWRRDYAHGIETGLAYFRRIPYLDFHRAGDHKYIWELNRHQHLVTLAQAYCFTGKPEYVREAQRQIESWLAANPFLEGINWTSALEGAFRALSSVWLDHLAGSAFPAEFRRRFLESLYRHGCFLERNLSIYFSANTHLLGEAVALHTLGALYPEFPGGSHWREVGGEIVREQMRRQVLDDGAHFERSTYYHVYALDFFLWHDLLAETGAEYRQKLVRMAEYLDALLGPAGRIPLIGDDDGGRMFHPYGDREAFGRATMATCSARFERPEWIRSASDLHEQGAWWIGEQATWQAECLPHQSSRLFPNVGIAVMRAGDAQVIVKAGGFGPSTAGHSHSDCLSVVVRQGVANLLVDSGTYTYLADPEWRNRFRGSAGHNTIRIDEQDQARPAGPFRWENPPESRILQWLSNRERDFLDAECRYNGFVHRRRVLFRKPDLVVVVDDVAGPPNEHLIEQFWHSGAGEETFARMGFSCAAAAIAPWHSRVFGSKELASGRCVSYRGPLPVTLAAAISFEQFPESISLENAAATVNFRGGEAAHLRIE